MLASELTRSRLVELVAPFVWRNDARAAKKLRNFACTEFGSALDMFHAAEKTEDPRLRRLFFRHALDEAKHARMFQAAARSLAPSSEQAAQYDLVHATRQNLFSRFSLIEFVAFVHLSEKRGEAHFRSLARHFRGHPLLEDVLETIARDERFHVSYTRRLLEEFRSAGRGAEVTRSLWRVRLRRSWEAWRRAGRRLGDVLNSGLLLALFVLVVPPFAGLQRLLRKNQKGWQRRQLEHTVDAARRQF